MSSSNYLVSASLLVWPPRRSDPHPVGLPSVDIAGGCREIARYGHDTAPAFPGGRAHVPVSTYMASRPEQRVFEYPFSSTAAISFSPTELSSRLDRRLGARLLIGLEPRQHLRREQREIVHGVFVGHR